MLRACLRCAGAGAAIFAVVACLLFGLAYVVACWVDELIDGWRLS